MYSELFLHLNRLLAELDRAHRIMADLQRCVAETRHVAVHVDPGPGRTGHFDDFLRAYS